MSTDDEENQSEITKFTQERDQNRTRVRELFEDVVDDFHELTYIKQQFQKWKVLQNESYTEAYIALCLPKLFTPFIKLKLVDWNPLEKEAGDFEEMGWYETLMFYGYKEGAEIDKSDPDNKLMPSIVDKVLLPKLTGLIEKVWDPLSCQQTRCLVQLCQKLVRDYHTVSSDNKNIQGLVKAAIARIRKTIDDDVFMPLYPMSVFEEKRSAMAECRGRHFLITGECVTDI
jgi:GC-rich sequence DNA-binding factor